MSNPLKYIDKSVILTDLWIMGIGRMTVEEPREKLIARINQHNHERELFQFRYRTDSGKVLDGAVNTRHIIMVGVEGTFQEVPADGVGQPIPMKIDYAPDPRVLNIGGKKQ